ncbi:TonB family protein [Malonomonas rubra]|uniref:TonB family protein n=1 Tax=Malonomonas rubra TaxID=57040 RepID=UPI0026F034E8|nr:TonB family protein [Malonomonas rubra]
MDTSNRLSANQQNNRPALLVVSLLFSILLHLSIVLLVPWDKLNEEQPAELRQQPTIVKLVEKPENRENKVYELDQQPVKPSPEPPPESSRLAEANQRVEKEMAPKGEDSRDQAARPAPTKPIQPQPTNKTVKAEKKQPTHRESEHQLEAVRKPTPKEDGKLPDPTDQPLPSLEQLTHLTPSTLGRIVRTEQAAQEKIKERNDLESGDTVWLNLERGLLISFFRRFRNQIEGVWNYPREAIEKEQQGTLLLKITVDREGKLLDADLLNSSGSDILDYEAIQAVYRAAPFGPLGKHYPYPELKIMAHFRYQLTGKYIFGRNR